MRGVSELSVVRLERRVHRQLAPRTQSGRGGSVHERALQPRGECGERGAGSVAVPDAALLQVAGHPDAKGRPRVALTPDELKTLACWIDLGVPFCGGYTELHDWNDWYRQRYLYFQNKRIYFAGEELNDIRRERKLNPVPLTGFVPGIAAPRRQRSWSE